jgi:dethiobiotin synthetase
MPAEPSNPTLRGIFVTGTDTGVGKTVVVAVLARLPLARGLRVGVYTPVQTGVAPGEPGDLDFVVAANADLSSPLVTHCAWRSSLALAPAVAAALEGRRISLRHLVEEGRRLARDVDVVIVEGAGGLLVPLTRRRTMADLARALGAPLLVVARPGLGTLNHAALTVEAARRRGLPVLGLVICGYPPSPDLASRTNPAWLERLAAPVLGTVPWLAGLSTEALAPAGLVEAAARSLPSQLVDYVAGITSPMSGGKEAE